MWNLHYNNVKSLRISSKTKPQEPEEPTFIFDNIVIKRGKVL